MICVWSPRRGSGTTRSVQQLAQLYSAQHQIPTLVMDMNPNLRLSKRLLASVGMRYQDCTETSKPRTFCDLMEQLDVQCTKASRDRLVSSEAYTVQINSHLWLGVGNPDLMYVDCKMYVREALHMGKLSTNRLTRAVRAIIVDTAKRHGAHVVLIDMSSYLGALDRTLFLSSDAWILTVPNDAYAPALIKESQLQIADWVKKGEEIRAQFRFRGIPPFWGIRVTTQDGKDALIPHSSILEQGEALCQWCTCQHSIDQSPPGGLITDDVQTLDLMKGEGR